MSTQTGRGGTGGVVSLRDTDGDGKFDKREKFGEGSVTGIGLRNGYVYYATTNRSTATSCRPASCCRRDRRKSLTRIDRSAPARGQRARVRRQRRRLRQHRRAVERVPAARSPAEGRRAGSVSAARDAGGIWRFDENKLGQKQADGKRYATGMRQMPGITWHDDPSGSVMHNRDRLDTTWPGQFTAEQNAEWPAEGTW